METPYLPCPLLRTSAVLYWQGHPAKNPHYQNIITIITILLIIIIILLIIIIIMIRGGSKGIPLKNLAPLGSRPLLSWALGAVLEFGRFCCDDIFSISFLIGMSCSQQHCTKIKHTTSALCQT